MYVRQKKVRSMKKLRPKQKKNILFWLAVTDLVLILILSTTLAFFTGYDEVSNRFEAKNMNIDLYELNYSMLSEKQKSTLVPNRILPKDPRIQNTDQTDVFVFLKVTVPVYYSTTSDDDGNIIGSKHRQEIFLIKTEETKDQNTTGFNTQKNESDINYWTELYEYEEGTDYQGDFRTYVFGYNVYLKQYELSETLFDYVELKNIKQFEITSGDILDVRVEAYGIQADYLEGIEKDNGTEKAVMSQQQLSEIYSYVMESEESSSDRESGE